MLEDYRPPTMRERLLSPVGISLVLLVVLVGGWYGYDAYVQYQRAALDEALAPLEQQWDALQHEATPHLAAIEAALHEGSSPAAEGCDSLQGSLGVVHRPLLEALAAGERMPREGPHWLNSSGYQYLAVTMSPGRDVNAYREREDRVRAELARACVAVVETALAEDAKLQGEGRFEGGVVAGRLRVVCPRSGGLRCEGPLVSAPTFAISVKQRDGSAQESADRMAVSGAARHAYWDAVEATLKQLAPGLGVEARPAW